MTLLARPPWVQLGDVDRRILGFRWDDARAYEDFEGDPSRVIEAAAQMSIRARLVLLLGLYEWIVWRFEGLHRREEDRQILDAAWCGTVDPRYLKFFELDREEWVGPVEGPLWCAFTFLERGFRQSHVFTGDTYQALEFNYLLALHVVPDARRLEEWLDLTLKRFSEAYPVAPEDPFEDVFEEYIGEHLGALIGRDALDPSLPLDGNRDREFLARMLEGTRAAENPFLADEDELEEIGFAGVPYELPEV